MLPLGFFRNRRFTGAQVAVFGISAGMFSLYIYLGIYLQSVLGYSALKAGLVLAPMSIVSMFIAPVAGKMSDRVGGKYILMAGLTCFAVGGAWFTWIAQVDSDWPSFILPSLLMGVGFGCIFAPMATEALRRVPPQLAGAAAGVNNTIRQVGSVVGSAAVGALLQSQLASKLHEEAVSRSAALPSAVRSSFVSGFSNGGSALEVGGGQTGAAPKGVPAQVAAQLQQIGAEVFRFGFVRAMHPTIVLPIAAMVLGALSCFLVHRHVGAAAAQRAAATHPQPAGQA